MIDWVPKCFTHKQPSVRIDTGKLQLQCDECSRQGVEQPLQDWIDTVVKTSQEAIKHHKACQDLLKPETLKTCMASQITLKSLQREKLKISEYFRNLKTTLFQRIDALQEQTELHLDQAIIGLEGDSAFCQKVLAELEQCFKAYPLQNPNNIQILLQQEQNLCAVQELMDTLINIQQQDKKSLVLKFKTATHRIQECEQSINQFNKELVDSVVNKMLESIPTFQTRVRSNFQSTPQTQRANTSVSPINREKENNYFSHNPSQAMGPSNIGTPLSTNRTQLKMYSMPSEKSLSKSPNRQKISPSPLRQAPPPAVTQSVMITNGNKNLLINQEKKQLNPMEISIKPLKKYQIDFSIASVEVIDENIFAMSSTNDPYLRIFDTTQKRIHTLQSHIHPITVLEKSQSSQKKQKHLITLSSDSIVIWIFEALGSGHFSPVPQVLHKIKINEPIKSICLIQDTSNIIMGDQNGQLMSYNFVAQKYGPTIERQHFKTIVNITYIPKSKKVIVLSDDNTISLWRTSSRVGESILIDTPAFTANFGSLRTVNLLNNQNLVLLGNSEGQFKLLNLMTQNFELETPLNIQFPIVDAIVAEDHINDQCFCALTLCQNQRSLKLFKVQTSGSVYSYTENRADVAMLVGESISRSKLQYVQLFNGNYFILMANETGKELLVYELTQKL